MIYKIKVQGVIKWIIQNIDLVVAIIQERNERKEF